MIDCTVCKCCDRAVCKRGDLISEGKEEKKGIRKASGGNLQTDFLKIILKLSTL